MSIQIRFPVHLPNRQQIDVVLCANEKTMLREAEYRTLRAQSEARALFISYGRPTWYFKNFRCIGALLFVQGDTSPGVVAHEALHAALHWGHINRARPKRDTLRYTDAAEERIAAVLQHTVEKVTAALSRTTAK